RTILHAIVIGVFTFRNLSVLIILFESPVLVFALDFLAFVIADSNFRGSVKIIAIPITIWHTVVVFAGTIHRTGCIPRFVITMQFAIYIGALFHHFTIVKIFGEWTFLHAFHIV